MQWKEIVKYVWKWVKFPVFQYMSETITTITSRKHASSIVSRMYIQKLWLSAPSVTQLNIDKTSYLTTHLAKKFGAYKYSKLASFPNLEYTIVLPDTQSLSRVVWDSREDVHVS
jgi:hypothetical protein